ncbi:MAG: tetratricopeptide repeat protein, partial [Anaerolineales bacterium]
TFEAGSRVLERELPLATLRQFYADLPERKRGVLSIAGPAGSGKTWFLAEAARMARLRGYAVWNLEGRRALRNRVLGAAAEAKPLAPNLPPPAAGDRVYIRALQQYVAGEGKAGVILVVDNLAEMDRATLDLLRRLLYAPEMPVVALVYTLDPAAAYPILPLEAPLEAQIALRPLTTLGVRLWLRSVLHWEAPEAFCHWLHHETSGLPGRLQAALNYLVQQELLAPQEAGWALAPAYSDQPLREVIERLLRTPPHNLPISPVDFVGRDDELRLLKQRIDHEPLITVIGPGGIGKTRLVVQAASEMLGRFVDGVTYVPLNSVTALDHFVSTLAQALDLSLSGPEAAREQLLNCLAEQQRLLVLDDFQYQLEAADLLGQVLARAPKVRLLITTREALDLPGEFALELRGLPIPPAAAESLRTGALEAAEYSAEQLYVLAAQRAAPGFALTDEDRLYVRRICQLVEGMPLAIELAAAWTPLFSSREIAQQIERNVDFLATAQGGVPERQRSTRAVLDYFWSLLSEDERRRVRGLAVFRGGFEREAARQVAEASVFFLSALVDKAFLRRTPSGRYEMHELLRQYGALNLAEDGAELAAVGDRHSQYFADFMQQQYPALKGGRQLLALDAINAEMGNIRAAWQWSISHGQAAAVAQFFDCLVLFFDTQNWFHEGAETFARAQESWRARPGQADQAEASLARLLAGEGIFSHRLGRNKRAAELLAEAYARFQTLPAAQVADDLALTLYFSGLVQLELGAYDEARKLLEASLALRRELDDLHGVAVALNELADVAYHLGSYADASGLYAEALRLRRQIGDQHGVARSLGSAGELALDLGDYAQAQPFLREAAELARAHGQRLGLVRAVRALGLLADTRAEYDDARRFYAESLGLDREAGSPREIAHDLCGLANVALHTGDLAEAHRLHAEALELCRAAGYRRGIAMALIGLGEVATLATPLGETAYPHFEEALSTAMSIRALPWVLAALVGIAALWVKLGRRGPAAELLTLALYHPACNRRTQDWAARQLSRLESELPGAEVALAEERGRRRQLEEAV